MRFIGIDPVVIPVEVTARSERVSGTLAARKAAHLATGITPSDASFQLAHIRKIRTLLAPIMLRRTSPLQQFVRRVVFEDFETQAERTLYRHYYARFCETCRRFRGRR